MAENLKAELLFRGSLVLDTPQPVGDTPHGSRNIIRVVSGTLEGPRIKGETLPMSGDWLLLRPDGVGELDVRSTIRTNDDQYIYMSYRGLMHGTPETMQRMFQGVPIKPEDLYFRTAPFFETGSEKYAWMNKILTVCYGVVAMPKLDITVYTIL
jgi:hypothetical protein